MKLTKKDVTQAVKSSVSAYLMARAYAETMREKVDVVYKDALKIFPLWTDLERRLSKRPHRRRRIFSHSDMYMSEDEEAIQDVYADVNHQLRKQGLKPDDMPDEHCPALVAEDVQRSAEHILIDAAAEMLGENGDFRHTLICNGMENYHKFIDLVTKLVVNLPDFRDPLRGKKLRAAKGGSA